MSLYYSVIDHRWRQNVLEVSVSLKFLPHFDVFFDPTATWNLFVLSETHMSIWRYTMNWKEKNADKHTWLEPLEFSIICTSLDILSPKR